MTRKDACRKLIDAIGLCRSLRTSHPENYQFFYELFQRHPRAEAKRLADVIDIYIDLARGDYRMGYVLSDGSRDTISWNKCLTGRDHTAEGILSRAMRTSVDPQLAAFRRTQPSVCVLCGSTENMTADHYPVKFRDIKSEFLVSNPAPIEFSKNSASQDCFRVEDASYEKAWKDFHHEKATYRMLCYTCNRSIENKNNECVPASPSGAV